MSSQNIVRGNEKIYVRPGVIFFLYNNLVYVIDLANKKIIKFNRKIWPILINANGISENMLVKITTKIYGLDPIFVKKTLELLENKNIITYEDLDLKFKAYIKQYLNDISDGRRKRRIYLEMTTACNAKCIMCYNVQSRKNLKTKEWFNILEYTPPSILIVTGGEPFIRKDLVDILLYGASRGHEYFILTNGTLINEDIVEKILEIKEKVIRIRISVHGASEEIHDNVTCLKGSFNKIIDATKLLVRKGFEVEWTTTVNKINFSELSKIIAKARELGVKYFSAYPVDPMGRCLLHPDILLSASEKARLQLILSEFRDAYPDIIVQEDSLPQDLLKEEKMLYPACKVGLGSFMILSNGDIAVCPAIQLPEKINILEIINEGYTFNEFEQLLYQHPYFRRLLYTPIHRYGSCGHCGLRYICKGACRGRALQYTGDIHGCDLHIREMIIEYIQRKMEG